jgi:hypothetical protein
MSFRHERRRRFIADEAYSPIDEDGLPPRAVDESRDIEPGKRAYSDAARSAVARPLRSLLAERYLTLGLVALAGLAIIAVLELMHVWSGRLADRVGRPAAAVFDLREPGNVSGWFACLLLFTAALVSTFIYSLRRHRVDDYHGRYRVWIWTAIVCLAASFGETTSVAALAREMCRRAISWSNASEALVWPSIVATVLAIAGVRILLEVRRCRTAVGLLAAGGVSFLAAAATSHGWLERVSPASGPLVERGSWLIGYVALLATFLAYARYVMLEIDGKIVVVPAAPRKRKVKPAASADADEAWVEPPRKAASVRTDLDSAPVAASPPPARTPPPAASAPKPTPAAVASTVATSGHGTRPLSRAERRRLRREARMQS